MQEHIQVRFTPKGKSFSEDLQAHLRQPMLRQPCTPDPLKLLASASTICVWQIDTMSGGRALEKS